MIEMLLVMEGIMKEEMVIKYGEGEVKCNL